MTKLNSPGMGYAQQSNAWNATKFMNEYAEVNNEYYPFVYGNPLGYAANTNSDPFFWGQPQAPRYCACGQSLKISQSEGFCKECNAGTAPLYSDRENASVNINDENSNVSFPASRQIVKNSIKTFKKQDINIDDPSILGRFRDIQTKQQDRFALNSLRHNEHMENFGTARPYGTAREYGTGSVGNGTVPGAPVVPVSYYYEGFEPPPSTPCNSSTIIGQHAPLTITAGGGIEYMYDSPAIEAATWDNAKRQSFCAATRGGKKLAF